MRTPSIGDVTPGSYPMISFTKGRIFSMKFLPILPQPITPNEESCSEIISAVLGAEIHLPSCVLLLLWNKPLCNAIIMEIA